MEGKSCETPGCEQPAKLQCPTCIKLGIQGSFFCSQECFKSNWDLHKTLHKLAKTDSASQSSKKGGGLFNPWPGYNFTGRLRPASQSDTRVVPDHIPRPDYAGHPEGYPLSEMKLKGNTYIRQLDEKEIEGLRVACRLGREVLDEAAAAITPGITTDEIDRIVHEATVDRECYPSPLNYYKFPKSCCTSVNEVICHGIPDKRPLQNGDICNVDVTVFHRSVSQSVSCFSSLLLTYSRCSAGVTMETSMRRYLLGRSQTRPEISWPTPGSVWRKPLRQ